MELKFTVTCSATFTSGKFASSDEVAEEIREAIEQADPGSVTANEGEYEISDYNVEIEALPTRREARKLRVKREKLAKLIEAARNGEDALELARQLRELEL